MKKILDSILLWFGYVPMENYSNKLNENITLQAKVTALEKQFGIPGDGRPRGFIEMILKGQQEHKEKDHYRDEQFKIVDCPHCNEHHVQCHSKAEFNEDMAEHLKTLPGVEECKLNGKYTLEIFKGYHFTWDEIFKKMIPAIKYFTKPVDQQIS